MKANTLESHMHNNENQAGPTCCVAQGTILDMSQEPIRKQNLKKNIYVYSYSYIFIYVYMNVHLKVAQHCKSTYFHKKKIHSNQSSKELRSHTVQAAHLKCTPQRCLASVQGCATLTTNSDHRHYFRKNPPPPPPPLCPSRASSSSPRQPPVYTPSLWLRVNGLLGYNHRLLASFTRQKCSEFLYVAALSRFAFRLRTHL